jgi:hypothetical protein
MNEMASFDQIIKNLYYQVIKNRDNVRIFPLKCIINGTKVLIFFLFS